jgi:8-oxo-dGTP diphosphatase
MELSTGTWAPPGGHLEFGESFADCASREVLEETGLATKNAGVVAATNDIFLEEGKHYVTLYVALDLEDPTAQPEVCQIKGEHFFSYHSVLLALSF